MDTPRHRPSAGQLAGAAGLGAMVGVLYAIGRSRPVRDELALPNPPEGLPPGRLVRVPGRGEMFVRDTAAADVPGAPSGADSPTILLLHGWIYPSDLNWFTCYEPLSELGRVVAVDHRGHGRGLRPSMPFRLADTAEDVAALVRHLGLGPVVAVGYSMGGPVAQLLWRRHPDLVTGLVLCATSATWSLSLRNRVAWRTMGALQVLLRLLPRHAWESLLAAQLRGRLPFPVSRMLEGSPPEETLALLPWIVGELDRSSAEDIAEAGRELGRFDSRSWLSEIDVPTAVLVTSRDGLVPAEEQRDLASGIAGCRVTELPLDHNGVVVDADVFVPALRKAVAQVLSDRPETGAPQSEHVRDR